MRYANTPDVWLLGIGGIVFAVAVVVGTAYSESQQAPTPKPCPEPDCPVSEQQYHSARCRHVRSERKHIEAYQALEHALMTQSGRQRIAEEIARARTVIDAAPECEGE
jgi:hypothetical protein